ncbi:MAG: hypothetical protein F8N37_22035 [Telmatospirillum sp.]|nr:hypothetical protein [Telmatospirillum sp.]
MRRFLALLCLILLAVPAAGQDDAGSGGPSLPKGVHIGALRRLPDGTIVPVEDEPADPPAPDAAPPKPPVTAAPATVRKPVAPTPAVPVVSPPPAPVITPPRSQAAVESMTVAKAIPCPSPAVTCVQVTRKDAGDGWQPVTFGQPFRSGSVPADGRLMAKDNKGHSFPVQMDARTSAPGGGGLRFAVLSMDIPDMASGETREIRILTDDGTAGGMGQGAGKALPAIPDLSVDLTLFSRQVTIVKFGNRNGTVPGIPFGVGETITIRVGEGAHEEHFTLTVQPKMSGGSLDPYLNIAIAFKILINEQSHYYRADWTDANDGYEKVFISTINTVEPFKVAVDYAGAAKIAVTPYIPVESRETWTARLTGPGTVAKPWLQGAVAEESDILVPLLSQTGGRQHPLLSVRYHLRRYRQSQAVRADVVIENDWAFEPGPKNVFYDVAIRAGDKALFSHSNVTHFHHARWHVPIWLDGRKEPAVRHDIPTILDSRLVLNYDRKLPISGNSIDADSRAIAKADTGPMGTAGVTRYMPTTGGRADIGPLPRWAVLYLLTMDQRERTVLFANADAGASMPVHYRDKQTDLLISLDKHPNLTTNITWSRGSDDRLPAVLVPETPWTLDSAHLPSLFYVPYLISGDLFYLEEIAFWGNDVIISGHPAYRDGARGLLGPDQTRGLAWRFRALGEAAMIMPDNHPLRGYFNRLLKNNLEWYQQAFSGKISSQSVSPLGILPKSDEPDRMAPWQQDFLMLSLGHLAEAGYGEARDLFQFLGRFGVRRWAADQEGYCHQMAPAYYIKIKGADGRYFTTLRDLFRANWPDAATCPSRFPFEGWGGASGYVAGSYAMLGLAVDLGMPDAKDGLRNLKADAQVVLEGMSDDPTYAVVPRGGE